MASVHKNDRLSTGVGIDVSDIQSLVRDLRRSSKAAATEMRATITGLAEIVAVEARSIAGEHSQSIPPTIKARSYLSGGRRSTSSVTAGKGVPLAALYELGNKGKSEDSPNFRHPVYERSASGQLQQTDDWVDQARFPFLKPAAQRKDAEVRAAADRLANVVAEIIEIGADHA
jgi:hypothetical protein